MRATRLNSTLSDMNNHTIICVDDEIDNVEALERLFRKKFSVLKATSGDEALKILDQNRGQISVIITDQRMPGMSGVELLEKSLDSNPDSVRILLTGYTDIDSIIGAVNQGQIFRYITKPWDPVDLMNTIERAAERFSLGQELKEKNRALEKALIELQQLDKTKSDFMILVNHELKTPLTSIISFQTLLRESPLDDEQKMMLDRAIKNTDRLKKLIDDVLLILRAENKQIIINLESANLKSLIKEIPISIQEMINKKKLKLTVRGSSTLVKIDIQYIKEVLFRLLDNAAKFSTESSEIILESQDLTHKVRFVMQNIGLMIPQTQIDKIINPFVLNEDIMNHSKGLGVGMTICQSLLKLHQSTLKVRNIDNGVIVYFELDKA